MRIIRYGCIITINVIYGAIAPINRKTALGRHGEPKVRICRQTGRGNCKTRIFTCDTGFQPGIIV